MKLISEEELKLIAYIIGERSAATQVLQDIAKRRTNGEDPICIEEHGTYYVLDRKQLITQPEQE